MLSGNHRVKASIDAGLKIITCLATEDELSNDSKIAIQLSHNALVGQDDIATLKQLYEEIDSTDYKKYSGLDDKTLGILEKVGTFSISEAHLDFRTLAMTFLPDDIEEVKRLFDEVKEKTKTADTMLVARMHEWDAWLDTQEMISSAYNVKNVATSVQIML